MAMKLRTYGASDALGEKVLPILASKKALIFWALEDPGFPRGDLERWERTFPEHKTVELAAASHFFFEDAAPLVIDEVSVFARRGSLAELPPSPADDGRAQPH